MLERNDQSGKYGQIQGKNLDLSDAQEVRLLFSRQSLLSVIGLIINLGLFQLALLIYGKN